MGLRRGPAAVVLAVVLLVACGGVVVSGNYVFNVESKFKLGGKERSLSALKKHDSLRHGRFLASVDLPLGGNGYPYAAGWTCFRRIQIILIFLDFGFGKMLVMFVFEGDIVLQIKLTLFDPEKSKTFGEIDCDDNFCVEQSDGQLSGCKLGLQCPYNMTYMDGSASIGAFVKDVVTLQQASGNFKTSSLNASIIFGCGARQTGRLGSSSEAAVDGILGFGQANSSLFSQLAAAGKVRKEFAHCLDVVKGGGIFAIGDVVQPVVKTTPLVPNMPHYNVKLKAIEVGGDTLDVPSDMFDTGSQRGTIIDSGTTLAYLPAEVYEPMMDKETTWCVGWQKGGLQSLDGAELILLGDLVLSGKLVIYDAANLTIGWTEYNCSSSIKVKDRSGAVYSIGSHNISSAVGLKVGKILTLLTTLFAMLHIFCVH